MRVLPAALGILLLALLLPPGLGSSILPGPKEGSWSRNLEVPAGQYVWVPGQLRHDSGGILVYGSFTVRSCCGFSTDDIVFRIAGLGNGRDYGIVVANLTFEYNSGEDDQYQLGFVNNVWNSSSPSYHNKTIDLVVREVVPFNPLSDPWALAALLPFLVVGAGALVLTMIILRRRKRQPKV